MSPGNVLAKPTGRWLVPALVTSVAVPLLALQVLSIGIRSLTLWHFRQAGELDGFEGELSAGTSSVWYVREALPLGFAVLALVGMWIAAVRGGKWTWMLGSLVIAASLAPYTDVILPS